MKTLRPISLALFFLLPAMYVMAKEKCRVIVTTDNGVRPSELVIKKSGEDPRYSAVRTKLEDGIFECEIETDEIEMYSIVDFGEVEEKGHTGRFADFLVEDSATVRIHFDGSELSVNSDGTEWQKSKQMDDLAGEWLRERLKELGTDNPTEEQEALLGKEFAKWKNDYHVAHPSLGFLLELDNYTSSYSIANSGLGAMLDIYHKHYTDKYPGHPVHARIAQAEKNGLQIAGMKYRDFTAYTTEMEKVQSEEYFRGKPTLVICWATWCIPCRDEARNLIPVYEKYHKRGLNMFSIAREFDSAENLKAAVKEDNYPWVCLLDLNDEFKIFNRHGITSSGLFLIDAEGTIVAAGFSIEDIEGALEELFKE